MHKEIRWGAIYAHKSDAFSSSDQWASEARDFISELPEEGVVLDFACNTGRFIELACIERPGVVFIGVDINAHALEIAEVRMPYQTWLPDFKDIPNDSVDCVVHLHALPYLQYPDTELAEAWRVLRRGGRFLLITNNKFNDWLWRPVNLFNGYRDDITAFSNYSLNEVKRLMKLSGFVQDSIKFSGDIWCGALPFTRPRIVYHGRKG